MIESIRIFNYQCHADLKLELSQITTIVGPSDTGKSAILRALRWVCFNKPDGDSFIREDSDRARVVLMVDGERITRAKGDKANSYFLNQGKLVSFGRGGVPDSIDDILNMSPANFQRQHDASFWFSLSAGDVSKELNQIVDLGIIDMCLSEANKTYRKARQSVEALHEIHSEAEADLKSLSYVPVMKRDYESLEELEKEAKWAAVDAEDLASIIDSMEMLEIEWRLSTKRCKGMKRLSRLYSEWMAIDDQILQLSNRMETAQAHQLILDRRPPSFDMLDKLYNESSGISSKTRCLEVLLSRIEELESTLCETKQKKEEIFARLPSKCPTCGTIR